MGYKSCASLALANHGSGSMSFFFGPNSSYQHVIRYFNISTRYVRVYSRAKQNLGRNDLDSLQSCPTTTIVSATRPKNVVLPPWFASHIYGLFVSRHMDQIWLLGIDVVYHRLSGAWVTT